MAWNNKISTVGSDCMGCTDRYPGCHDRCDKYKRAVAERNERNKKIKELRRVDDAWVSYNASKHERGQI